MASKTVQTVCFRCTMSDVVCDCISDINHDLGGTALGEWTSRALQVSWFVPMLKIHCTKTFFTRRTSGPRLMSRLRCLWITLLAVVVILAAALVIGLGAGLGTRRSSALYKSVKASNLVDHLKVSTIRPLCWVIHAHTHTPHALNIGTGKHCCRQWAKVSVSM